MKITITSTERFACWSGLPCRLWDGVTEAGTKCILFVHHAIALPREKQEGLDNELLEQLPLGEFVDLRHILSLVCVALLAATAVMAQSVTPAAAQGTANPAPPAQAYTPNETQALKIENARLKLYLQQKNLSTCGGTWSDKQVSDAQQSAEQAYSALKQVCNQVAAESKWAVAGCELSGVSFGPAKPPEKK